MKKSRLIWLLWLLAAGCLYFFENNSGTRIVFAVSILFPLLSALCALWCADHIQFTFVVPGEVRKNEVFDCFVKAVGSRLLAGCIPCTAVFMENLLTGDSYESGVFPVDRERCVQLSSAYCGSLVIRPASPMVGDRFGLFRFPLQKAAVEAGIMVYPNLTSVQFDGEQGKGHDEKTNSSGAEKFDESDPSAYNGIRDYIPGDPVRQIHWKLSVKTDRLLIRETEKEKTDGLLLWLETSSVQEGPQAMDQAVEAFLSLSRSLCHENYPHTTAWVDHTYGRMENWFVRSDEDFLSMQLALLHTRSSAEKETFDVDGISQYGSVIRFDPRDFTAERY